MLIICNSENDYGEHHLGIQQHKLRLLLRTAKVSFCSKLKLLCLGVLRSNLIVTQNHLSYNGIPGKNECKNFASIPIDGSTIPLQESKVCDSLTAAKPMTSHSAKLVPP